MWNKKCKKCNWISVKKDWFKRWKQRYKCKECWYVFQNNSRNKGKDKIWKEYTDWKQTYIELWKTYKCSIQTIQKELDKKKLKENILKPRKTVLLVDTTYFWRAYWIMVFRSYELKKNLLWKEVSWETLEEYRTWIQELERRWWEIQAIVCDWKKGLLNLNKPVQMCIFHQKQIIRRYITKNPKLKANKDLKDIVSMIWKSRKETIKIWIEDWYRIYKLFLEERNFNWKLIHTRTIKAYKSIIRNLEYLYTYEKYDWILDIPKTTNSLESVFSHMKQKVRIHRWLKKRRKLRLIHHFLSK